MNERHRLLFLTAAIALPAMAHAQTLGSAVAPTIDNPNRLAVTGVPAARRFFDLARTRRIDCCIIGDSNTRSNHVGHEAGMGLALGARFGTYACAVSPATGANWWGDPIASTSSVLFPPFISEGAPIPVVIAQFGDQGFPSGYATIPDGELAPSTFNSGLTLFADSPIDLAGPLRYHATQWIFGPTSAGYSNPSCRPAFPGNPTINYAQSPTLSSAGPTRRFQDFSFDVPAGPRDPNGLLFSFANWASARDARGPFLITWQRVENTARTTGISYSPLWGMGGQSAFHAAFAVQTALTPMREWLRQATRLQGGPPVLLVQIIHGGNDINCYAGSLGPIGGIDSSTPAGHADNIRGIIQTLRGAWSMGGNDPQNLFFLLGPYHPRPDANTPIPGYEQQWRDIAATDPQVFTVAGTMLSTSAQFLDRGYLSGGTDAYHLSPAGFITWGQTTVSALTRAICPTDFSENGEASIADIFAFLNAWFAHEPRTDFNYSGRLEVQDIFDFLSAWFGGCP
jgi:hypothetical protein